MVGVGVPVQVPGLAVRVEPCWVVPVMVGSVVLTGPPMATRPTALVDPMSANQMLPSGPEPMRKGALPELSPVE